MISITFDTDHMRQDWMSRFVKDNLSEMPGRATFFIHDNFPELFYGEHEICPHPFISDLKAWDTDLGRLEKFFATRPIGTRPHSCVFSHMLGIGLKGRGYSYISQSQNLYSAGLAPFRHPWGLWELPIYYMDNMDFWMPKNWPDIGHVPFDQEIIERAIESDGLFVFDIHPIHVALNTRTHADYVSVKSAVIDNGKNPFELAFPGVGSRDFFQRLCSRMKQAGVRSYSCAEVLSEYGCTLS